MSTPTRRRVADLLVRRLEQWGARACFSVAGGGAMHLNDAFGMSPLIRSTFVHHEQAAAIAGEGYARIAGVPAIVSVTSGPGGINALNGVFGAYTDSIPMIVVSGQVKRETLRSTAQRATLRQLGDQEADVIGMARPVTKAVFALHDPEQVLAVVDEAWQTAVTGRPGPVWIDVPVDVQGSVPSVTLPESVPTLAAAPAVDHSASIQALLRMLGEAHRPVLLFGSGVRIAGVERESVQLAERLGVPVVTAWTHDTIASDHPLFAGRPGTIGTRAGNFVVQSADLVVVLGSRLNIRQVSYNWASFARGARLVWVDIDPAEMAKPFCKAELPIVADLASFVPQVLAAAQGWRRVHGDWVQWCAQARADHEPRASDYPRYASGINAYHFVPELFARLRDDDIVACGDATATIVPFQVGALRGTQRLFSNSGCASMGYDLPAAIGAAVAAPERRVICLAGDGSIMMNLQELQTISGAGLSVKVLVLDNEGYLSIKQTQRNFFQRESGCSPSSGLTFPRFEQLGPAFGLQTTLLEGETWQADLERFLAAPGPAMAVVRLATEQEFEPRLKSRMVGDKIVTPELDDMYPFLDPATVESMRASAISIRRGSEG